MLAECSLYTRENRSGPGCSSRLLAFATAAMDADLTVLAPPHEIGLSAATGLLILLLSTHDQSMLGPECPMVTYMAAHRNPIRVHLATRCTLHLEGVVKRVLFAVLRYEVRDSAHH